MDILTHKANWDNWTYIGIYEKNLTWAVDPSDAEIIIQALAKNKLTLTHILLTHHHADHTAGISALKKAHQCTVLSPDPDRIPDTDIPVKEGYRLTLGRWTITVIATPGHTTSGVCYFGTHPDHPPVLFSGDTLFACGCGRIMEGSAETLYASLMRLAALPDQTCLYPGHDYTEENLRFALTLEPDNQDLKQMLAAVRSQNSFSPTTLAQEKRCNPFLCTNQSAIQQAVGMDDPVKVFAELRRRKDRF